MKTSIELPDALMERVRAFNKRHSDRPINVSAVCRIAIEKSLSTNKSQSSDNFPGDGRGRHVPLPPTDKGDMK